MFFANFYGIHTTGSLDFNSIGHLSPYSSQDEQDDPLLRAPKLRPLAK